MKKNLLLVLSALCVFNVFNVNLYAQEEQDEEKALTVEISGEIDASVRDYTGNRFDYQDISSAKATIPSFDVYMEYKLAPKWLVTAEAEFVSGWGIQVDEISITRNIFPALNIKGGLIQLPIGQPNLGYSYVDHFNTGNPESHYALLPFPMTEAGIALTGELDFGLNYQLSLSTGMNGMCVSPYYWMRDANQGFFTDETNFTSPAISFKLGYSGIEGLSLNTGIYYCGNIAKNMSGYVGYRDFCEDPLNLTEYKKAPLTIWFASAEYENDFFKIGGSYIQGKLDGATNLSEYLNTLGDDETLCSEGTLSKGVVGYSGELGVNLKNCLYPESKGPALFPFVSYDYYDCQKDFEARPALNGDDILGASKVGKWSFGCNWKPIENLAVKFNYTTRKIGEGKNAGFPNMNEFNLGIAYDFEL